MNPITFLTGFGLPRWLSILLLIAATLAVLATLKSCYDTSVIDAHDAETRAATAETALHAERRANTADTARQATNAASDAETRKAMTDAEVLHTEAARAPAGPVVRAAVDSLRRRAAASDTPAR